MGGLPRRFKASALINGDINQDCAFFHRAEHFPGHQRRCLATGDKHGAHNKVRMGQDIPDSRRTGHQGDTLGRHHIAQITQPIQIDIEDVDLGPHSAGSFGGIDAHRTASNNDHGGRINTGHAAQQNPLTALGHLQIFGAQMNRHGTGHLAHRCQQGQCSVSLLDGFIGYADGLAFNQGMS